MKAGIGFLVLLLIGIGLLGCAGGQVPTAATEAPVEADRMAPMETPRTRVLSPEARSVTTAVRMTAQAVVDITPPPAAKKAVELATQDLAQTEGIPRETMRLVSVEPVEWSDASLGCPEPEMVYAQVITPGFLIILEAKGKTFEYHTDAGRFVVQCQPGN